VKLLPVLHSQLRNARSSCFGCGGLCDTQDGSHSLTPSEVSTKISLCKVHSISNLLYCVLNIAKREALTPTLKPRQGANTSNEQLVATPRRLQFFEETSLDHPKAVASYFQKFQKSLVHYKDDAPINPNAAPISPVAREVEKQPKFDRKTLKALLRKDCAFLKPFILDDFAVCGS
jgi:hypothetical protein